MTNIKRNYQPIETAHGFLVGRACIFLDEVSFLYGTYNLRLIGEVNTSLVSNPPEVSPKLVPYELTFTRVLALKMIELDSWDFECASSFDEILNSQWVAEIGGKVTKEHKHFFFQTYDDIFEVVCSSYEFKCLEK